MSVLLGIIGTLVGVIVGAVLTRWIDARYEERHEVARTRAAALLLQAELDDVVSSLEIVLEEKKWTGAFLLAGLDEWKEHRELFLTAGMREDQHPQSTYETKPIRARDTPRHATKPSPRTLAPVWLGVGTT